MFAAALSAREALDIAVKGGARNLGRDDIGEIAPGFAADMAAWRTDTLGFSGTSPDPVAALVFCAPSLGFVDLSIINGTIIVEDGKFVSMDLKVIIPNDAYMHVHESAPLPYHSYKMSQTCASSAPCWGSLQNSPYPHLQPHPLMLSGLLR